MLSPLYRHNRTIIKKDISMLISHHFTSCATPEATYPPIVVYPEQCLAGIYACLTKNKKYSKIQHNEIKFIVVTILVYKSFNVRFFCVLLCLTRADRLQMRLHRHLEDRDKGKETWC